MQAASLGVLSVPSAFIYNLYEGRREMISHTLVSLPSLYSVSLGDKRHDTKTSRLHVSHARTVFVLRSFILYFNREHHVDERYTVMLIVSNNAGLIY